MAETQARPRHLPTRIHLTLAGWLFLAVAMMMGLAAVKSQAPLTFVLFGGMVGAVGISAAVAHRMVRKVSLRRDLPERVWQNQTAHFSYFLRNLRARGASLGLWMEERGRRDVEFAAACCVHLEPRAVFRAGGRFVPRRRGRVDLRRICLSTSFPFGLVRACRFWTQDSAMVVWPARGRLTRRLLHHGAVESSSAAPAPVQGGQDEFFGIREYRSGDNPRWIHWRRSAARTEPVVREMARPLPDILYVILDTRAEDDDAGAEAAREKMIRFAGTLIDHAFASAYKVGLAVGDRRGRRAYRPAPGVGQRCKLLDALAEADGPARFGLPELLTHVPPAALRNAHVIVISGRATRRAEEALRPIRAACRYLQVIGKDRLDAFFEDDRLSAQEAG